MIRLALRLVPILPLVLPLSLSIKTGRGQGAPPAVVPAVASPAEFTAQFERLCELACDQINNPARQIPKPVPFYTDSYAVRALCAGYDMTGNERYLETCRRWSDRMIAYQEQMAPKGAYYMNYGRQPGQNEGNWYVADNSSIAMGVLATAVRCTGAEKEKYLNSVEAFADLVRKNYIGEAGGVENAFWPQYSGEWWCSTGLFGSLSFLLADSSGEEQWNDLGTGTVNWLNHLDWTKVKFNYWKDGAPAVVMYVLEAYSAGMSHLKEGSEVRQEAVAKLAKAFAWMSANQAGRGGAGKWDYASQWGSKLGGLPFHMYVLSRYLPDAESLRAAADRELAHIGHLLSKDDSGKLSQLACFAMMSYAERLRPGAVYRPPAKEQTTRAAALPAERRLNIILILTDDMGIGDVGCYGGTLTPTPSIDRLAQEGIRFTQYYAAAPICSPSRAGIITGMFPGRWRLTSYLQTKAGNRSCGQADFLDPKAPSLPRALKAAGYATAHFGKWHLGGGRDVTDAPKFAAYGYDEAAGTWESPEPHPDITATNWIWSDQDKVKRWNRTAFFVDKTLDFLRRHKGRPCFVNLWPDDVHTPWVPGENATKGDTPKNLRRVLVEYDRQIGRLMDGLRELGVESDTLVIFTSDNGPLPTFQGDRAGGLRGSKLSLYEGGIRMPFIVRWPGVAPAGQVDEQTALHAVDLLPTLCAVAGAALPKDAAFDGEDLSAALRGTSVTRRRAIFWEYGRNEKSFAYPRIANDRSPNVAVRQGQWKLLVNADGSHAELYDIPVDRAEKDDVARQHPDVAKRLTDLALQWRRSLP